MANAKRNRRKTGTKGFDPTNTEVLSIALMGTGLLALLALVSFTPDDLPTKIPFSSGTETNTPAENFIGRLGAIGAGFSYYIFGAASYLMPVCLIWFGAAKLMFGARTSRRAMVGFALLLLSGCCLLEYQSWFFRSWPEVYNIPGAGGIVGLGIGAGLFAGLTGTVGAFLIMLAVYCAATVMVTGFHPVHFVTLCRDAFRGLRERREEARMAEASEAERLVMQKRKLEREQKKLERKIGKAGVAVEGAATPTRAEAAEATVELPLPGAAQAAEVEPPEAGGDDLEPEAGAEPKIYDASIRMAEDDDEKKPSIAEVLAANRAKAAAGKGTGFTPPADVEFPDYELPDLELLNFDEQDERKPADRSLLIQTQNTIIDTLEHFNVKVTAGDITRGPTITRYEIYPSKGLRVSRITQLEADIARATRAERINILAPIPGKDTVGIEIANNEKIIVPLRELFTDPAFTDPKHKIPLALGKDVYGNTVIGDLAKMPHLLVAGATGAGKSVCINGIIASMLYRFTPDELRFIMIDPKVVEMQVYNNLPHQIVPVVTDPKKVLLALRWVVNEMERRYQLFAKLNVRNFDSFNERKPADGVAAAAAGGGGEFFDEEGQSELDFDEAEDLADAGAEEYEEWEEVEDGGDAETEEGGDGEWEYEYEEVEGADESEGEDGEDGEWEYEYEEVEVEYEEGEEEESDGASAGEAAEDDWEDPVPAAHSEDLLTTHAVHTNAEPSQRAGRTQRQRDGEIAASVEAADGEGVEDIPDRLPYIVVIIDELADLMQTAPADVEQAIARIAQKARAAGIHLIIATQTPRADVVTGIIKANIPSRIAFQVSSALDSRVILDNKGAEKLVGKGDMLYLPPGSAQLQRAQGALITDQECLSVVNFCADQASPIFEQEIEDTINGDAGDEEEVSEEDEEIVEKCIEVIEQERRASTSLLQRRLRLGYTRAARMMDILEMRGIIGPGDGAKPREILVDLAD